MDIDASTFEYLIKLAERWEAFKPDSMCTGTEMALELRKTLAEITKGKEPVLELLIHCPRCLKQHVDEAEFAKKPHKTHACQFCGLGFSASRSVPSVGVQFFSGWKNETEYTITASGKGPPIVSLPSIPSGTTMEVHVREKR